MALAENGQAPRLVLDAGTGLQRLSPLLDGRPFRGSILLGHLHWDHTHGMPFAPAVFNPEAEVDLYLPDQENGLGAEEVLERAFSPPHFPITPEQLGPGWSFRATQPG